MANNSSASGYWTNKVDELWKRFEAAEQGEKWVIFGEMQKVQKSALETLDSAYSHSRSNIVPIVKKAAQHVGTVDNKMRKALGLPQIRLQYMTESEWSKLQS